MLAAVTAPASFAERYLPHADALRAAWEAEHAAAGPHAAHAFFVLLTEVVRRALRLGEHAGLPALFAELERSLDAADPHEAEAARTCFLEDVAGGAPEVYVHVLPWLGPHALAFLRAWEAGAQDPFLSREAAEAGLVATLAAGCPAMARAWAKAAVHVSAHDGTTTAHGIADLAFEVVRAALAAGDDAGARALLAALETPLAGANRAHARAFERCFLDRLRELTLAQLVRLRPHLGPRASTYWDVRLRLGEPRFGVWEERPSAGNGVRLSPTMRTRRDDAWGWRLSLPRGEAGAILHESLQYAGQEVGEDESTVDPFGEATGRWTWSADDPSGAYALDLWLGDRRLGRFEFTLE